MSNTDITKAGCIEGFVRMCDDGYALGFNERNGGNATYRMTDKDVEECRAAFSEDEPWTEMDITAGNLAGEYFITTGIGKYMRNIILDIPGNIGIVKINDEGNAYKKVWGLDNGARPTSEFPSHLLNHSVRKRVTDGADRVIYHLHPVNVITLSFILPLNAREFSRVLWKSMTECPIVFPEGVGVVPWMVPGGREIALATSKLMEKYQAAVWAHHGLFVTGPDFDTAFGLAHTIEKSAAIYVNILKTGRPILQDITDDDLREVSRAFNVSINEEFLD